MDDWLVDWSQRHCVNLRGIWATNDCVSKWENRKDQHQHSEYSPVLVTVPRTTDIINLRDVIILIIRLARVSRSVGGDAVYGVRV